MAGRRGTRGPTVPIGKDLPARALQLLRSERIAEAAWGAYLCGSLLVADCGAPLIAELDKASAMLAAPDDGEEFFFVQAVLDSLIRLGAVVPASLVMRFDPRWRDEVIILLARAPRNEEVLLRLREQQLTSAEWLAVNNLLLRMKSRSFFLRTLQEAHIEHFFSVYDFESQDGYLTAHGDGIGAGNLPIRKVPSGFPPVGIYELREFAIPRATVLAWGPCYNGGTVSYIRTEIREEGTKVQPRRMYPGTGSIECRNAYLAAFCDIIRIEAANQFLRPTTKIHWTTAAAFLREANAALDLHAQALQNFIRGARIADLVDPATFHVTIHPHVIDTRDSKTTLLPKVAPREVGLN